MVGSFVFHYSAFFSYYVASKAHINERRIGLKKLSEMIEETSGLSMLPKDTSYTMAYVPFQQENSEVYSADQGFSQGTMFPELNKPFYIGMCGDMND